MKKIVYEEINEWNAQLFASLFSVKTYFLKRHFY